MGAKTVYEFPSVSDVLRMGAMDMVRMALRGKLRPSHVWVAMRGAEKFVEAMRRGDVATDQQLEIRGKACASCGLCTEHATPIAGTTKRYCGAPYETTDKTCGCLVGVTINGVFYAGGKAAVRTESCWNWPQ